jgi:hypothetical protein
MSDVHELIQLSADRIAKRYRQRIIDIVSKYIEPGENVLIGNGTYLLTDINGKSVETYYQQRQKVLDVLMTLQYPIDRVYASDMLPDESLLSKGLKQ